MMLMQYNMMRTHKDRVRCYLLEQYVPMDARLRNTRMGIFERDVGKELGHLATLQFRLEREINNDHGRFVAEVIEEFKEREHPQAKGVTFDDLGWD